LRRTIVPILRFPSPQHCSPARSGLRYWLRQRAGPARALRKIRPAHHWSWSDVFARTVEIFASLTRVRTARRIAGKGPCKPKTYTMGDNCELGTTLALACSLESRGKLCPYRSPLTTAEWRSSCCGWSRPDPTNANAEIVMADPIAQPSSA